jgi:hypothetical protein
MVKCNLESIIKKTLTNTKLSAVAFKDSGEITLTFVGSGVKPIYDFVSKNIEQLDRFYSLYWGDRVVGKASALLLLLVKPKYIYGELMSEEAIKILSQNNIPYSFGKKVPYIMNIRQDDMCPFEKSVLDVNEVELALQKIAEVFESLKKK